MAHFGRCGLETRLGEHPVIELIVVILARPNIRVKLCSLCSQCIARVNGCCLCVCWCSCWFWLTQYISYITARPTRSEPIRVNPRFVSMPPLTQSAHHAHRHSQKHRQCFVCRMPHPRPVADFVLFSTNVFLQIDKNRLKTVYAVLCISRRGTVH